MSGADLHEMLADNRELISDTWYYFLTVHLAVFGIVYIAQCKVHIFERFILVLGYAGFLFFNYSAQIDNYLSQSLIVDQINALPEAEGGHIARALLGNSQNIWVSNNLDLTYLGAGICSALIILLVNRGADHAR